MSPAATVQFGPEFVKVFADTYIAGVNRLRGQADGERIRLERRRAEIKRRLDRLIRYVSPEVRMTG